MDPEIIKIKCPFCGAVLKVQSQPGIERLSVTCPVCKQQSPFTNFQRIAAAPPVPAASSEDATQYGGRPTPPAMPGHGGTQIPPKMGGGPGRLVLQSTGQIYPLREGINVVGRAAAGSTANVQIPCPPTHRTSRDHIVIEVKNISGHWLHNARLAKERVNPTRIGTQQLYYGEVITLNPGDTIALPEATLRFEL